MLDISDLDKNSYLCFGRIKITGKPIRQSRKAVLFPGFDLVAKKEVVIKIQIKSLEKELANIAHLNKNSV